MTRSDVPAATYEYMTEAGVAETSRAIWLQAHPDKGDPKLKQANEEHLASEAFRGWVQARVAEARKLGRILTPQQMQDVRARRELRENDRVRYVGPERLEPVLFPGESLPHYLNRPHGQIGRIVAVTDGVLRFFPELQKGIVRAAQNDELDIHVVPLETRDWRLFERIPPVSEPK